MYSFKYNFGNALARSLLFPLEDTIWAKKFSEENFSKITIGMTEDNVYSTLGHPIRNDCRKDSCLLEYTLQSDGNSSHDQRNIFLHDDRKVRLVVRQFWID